MKKIILSAALLLGGAVAANAMGSSESNIQNESNYFRDQQVTFTTDCGTSYTVTLPGSTTLDQIDDMWWDYELADCFGSYID